LAAQRGSCVVVATHIGPAPTTAPAKTLVARHNKPSAPTARGHVTPVRAQLASLRSFEGAERERERLNRRYADVLERTHLTISRIDQGDRGIFYRVLTAPLPNRGAATGLCHRIGVHESGCVLIRDRQRDAWLTTGPPEFG